ncbi:DUF1700 domain-containing protein [Tissierella praeacuta]|uniref:DUF1700 domain-containing protein n=1 Tax=Tissierella praeacuta TaxID=43131 RepID=UPI0028AD543C|nr:DUF1700 domain-containing protein [Tissierella praeacuta]
MRRKEYLDRLKTYLQGLPIDEIQDILTDYEEHFDIGISKGKPEEEISRELGDPKEIANNYRTTYRPNYNKNNYSSNDNTRRLLITLLLIGFNLMVILAPFMTLLALLIGSYGISFSLILGGMAILFGFPISLFKPMTSAHILTSISFSIGFIALGALGIILSIYLTKEFYKLVVKYIQWNVEVINK